MGSEVRVLVLGASGMLGHVVFRCFAQTPGFRTTGSVRSALAPQRWPPALREQIVTGVEVNDFDALVQLLERERPDVVINCVGVVKQAAASENPLTILPVNALLPHRLLRLCRLSQARLIHISTDCVFDGRRGMYRESDVADARDLYGLSKLLGEIDAEGAVTLRTSVIGPELEAARGLIGWFLAQRGPVKGFTRAIFSGLPSIELARLIRDVVIPRTDLSGLYHVSAAPISKHDLLRLVAEVFGRSVDIVADDALAIDRSLDSTRFREQTGYIAPPWPALVRAMHEFG